MDSKPFTKIPNSIITAQVSIIDTSLRISGIPSPVFLGPDLEGFEKLSLNAYAFLISHIDSQTGQKRRILFDLGPPKDWEHDLPPSLVQRIKSWGATIEIDKNISEIIEGHGVPLESIEATIWSHPHWDHIGRPSLFPKTTTLLVGPGVKSAYYPGYPENESSPILSREFAERTVTELDFTASNLSLGGFKALDYFGDGSFYLLSAPGHAIGHIMALARTTHLSSKSTFILMGADSFHHPSQLRPHKHLPLPSSISESESNIAPSLNLCLGLHFEAIHPAERQLKSDIPNQYTAHLKACHSDSKTSPFFTVSQNVTGQSVAVDITQARETIGGVQAFDGDPNVLVIAAHDATLAPILEYLPVDATEWKEKGWKEQGRWRFLADLARAVELRTHRDVNTHH